MKKSKLLLFILLFSFILSGCSLKFPSLKEVDLKGSKSEFINGKDSSNKNALKICPDEWIDNMEPPVNPIVEERQYFIVNGERIELSELDVDWIRENCEVKKPSPVY